MLPTTQFADRDRVQVDVGVVSRVREPKIPVPVALIALAADGTRSVAAARPGAVVRVSKMARGSVSVEQLRFVSQSEARLLPGLDGPEPSRLRDAAVLALNAGAPFVDVVLVYGTGLPPWQLDRQALMPVLEPFLEFLFGALLVYPDVAGPASVGPTPAEDPAEAWHRLRRFVRIHGRGWSERYQIALLDSPPGLEEYGDENLGRALGVDAAVCAWSGPADAIRRQGWRCGAAAVAGLMLSFGHEVYRGPTGNVVELGPGRRSRPVPRFGADSAATTVPRALGGHSVVELRLDPSGVRARIASEPTLRRPRGSWSLAALRTAKAIHQRVVQAAEQVVFRPANEAHAFALVVAIDEVIRPFVTHGILAGPGGNGPPELESEVVPNPAAPGLVATITGQLKPWCTVVKLNVEVRDAGRVGMEAAR